MKNVKKSLISVVALICAAVMVMGTAFMAYTADDSVNREFNDRWDAVFEDFARSNISNTTTANGDGVSLGEAPYLHVEYTAEGHNDAGQIYKQGSSNFGSAQSGGEFVFRMRSADLSTKLEDIELGIRGVDDDAKIFWKPLSEYVNKNGEKNAELTSEWSDVTVSIPSSFNSSDTYPDSSSPVLTTAVLAIHLRAAEGKTGQVDIQSIDYAFSTFMDFTGGNSIIEMASSKGPTWWAGSLEGIVQSRQITVSGTGSLDVVGKEDVANILSQKVAVSDSTDIYAFIDADKTTNVAVTTDGVNWSEPVPCNGVIRVDHNVKGFRIISPDGEPVVVSRIWISSLYSGTAQTAVPVIDASTVDMLDNFSVSQSGFTGDHGAMVAAPEMAKAGMDYRKSYQNGNDFDALAIENGTLIFKADKVGPEGYTSFRFKSKAAHSGKYIVFKVKYEEGLNLDTFRFNLVTPSDGTSNLEPIWFPALKSGLDFPMAGLDSSNPYVENDGTDTWYYLIIDIIETGFAPSDLGYCGLDLYYAGEKDLVIDSVFFCNKLADIVNTTEFPDAAYRAEGTGEYTYGYMYVNNLSGKGKILSFDVTPDAEGFDAGALRIEFEGASKIGPFWGTENPEGTFLTTDGKQLRELTYSAGTATHIDIDLEKSGIDIGFEHVHVHYDGTVGVSISNVTLTESCAAEYLTTPVGDPVHESETGVFAGDNVINDGAGIEYKPNAGGYQYGGSFTVAEAKYDTLTLTITPGEGFTPASLRFEMGGGVFWGAENEQGSLKTVNGKLLNELEWEPGTAQTVIIDLAATGVQGNVSTVHIHADGTDTGSFAIADAVFEKTVQKYECEYYAQQLEVFRESMDAVKPELTITTPTTANAGDKVNVTWTATDNIDPSNALTASVTVVKDGREVTLDGRYGFTAEAGTYIVTVEVTDTSGNTATGTMQLTVSGEGTASGTPDDSNDAGGSLTWLWVILAILVVAGIVIAVVLVRKKHK